MKKKKTMKKKRGGTPSKSSSKYKNLTYKTQVYRTKSTIKGEKLYNPLTKRWIQNTASNRNSVLKQIEKSDVEQESPGDYRLEQFSDELLPRLFKSPGSDGTPKVSSVEAMAEEEEKEAAPEF